MRSFYIWIALLVVVGFGISLYLIPSKEDLALIKLKSNKLEEAENYYQQQYEQGIRTPNVIISLSRLYEKQGNLKAAILVMKEYVRLHPTDVLALRELANLYRQNQEYQEFYQTLLGIQKEKADKETLQDLLEWYQGNSSSEESFATEKEYVKTGKADESDYLALAYFYAARKDYSHALETLEKRRKLFPKAVGINDLLFEVWVDVELSKIKEDPSLKTKAINLLTNFLNAKNDPKLAYYALGVVNTRYPELTPLLIEQIQPLIEKDTLLTTLTLHILWENPAKKQQVLFGLLKLFNEDPFNPQLQNFIFNVLLDRKADDWLTDFIGRIPAQNIEDREIINLATTALMSNTPMLAKEMQNALGSSFLEKHPLLRVALAIGAQEKDAREQLDAFLSGPKLTHTESYFLLRLAAAAKYESEALRIGRNLPPYIGLADYELVDIALAYTQIHHAQDLYALMADDKMTPSKRKQLMPALMILEAALGHSRKVAEWLKDQKEVKEPLLSGLYTVAEESKEYPLALYVAKRRLQSYPTELAEADYALALVQVGKVGSGLSILKDLYAKHPRDLRLREIYFSALSEAVKKNPLYRDELFAFMTNIENKDKNISPELLRNFGYIYLEVLHDYPKAITIFQKLSVSAQPQSTDLQTLIYLWGPKLSDENIEWLERRAWHSNSAELGYWLEYLIFVQRYDTVINIFQCRSGDKPSLNAYFAYMEALAYEQRKAELKNAIDNVFSYSLDEKQLKKLSLYAGEAEYLDANRWIWERITYEWPNNSANWQSLARVAFDQHDYIGTYRALANSFDCSEEFNSKLYEQSYEYAEILTKQRNFREAKYYYRVALFQIDEVEEHTPHMTELKALILYKLDKTDAAQRLLFGLYQQIGEDPNIGASYANMLMDAGYLQDAEAFLKNMWVYSLVGEPKCN